MTTLLDEVASAIDEAALRKNGWAEDRIAEVMARHHPSPFGKDAASAAIAAVFARLAEPSKSMLHSGADELGAAGQEPGSFLAGDIFRAMLAKAKEEAGR